MLKMNVYEMITERIISELEHGIIPWEKPWTGIINGAYNRVSKKPYSLLNQMLLSHPGEYATYKQWSDLGGKVRKGEKSEIVVFWKMLNKKVDTESDECEGDDLKQIKKIPLLRYINVFHISQVDGIEPLGKPEMHNIKPIEKAEIVLHNYWDREQIKVKHVAGDEAYYSPTMDLICLPLFEQFKNANEYYSTAFHESVHSTMTRERCNRVKDRKGVITVFGDDNYSEEELIAEIGSASILNQIGLETEKTFRNSTAYIQNWLRVLRNDVKFIVFASKKAEKAVEYILL